MLFIYSIKSIFFGGKGMENIIINKVVEAYQRGRRNNLSEIEGLTVVSVKDEGKTMIEIEFDDGSVLEVSGKTQASDEAIYYKLHKRSKDEDDNVEGE